MAACSPCAAAHATRRCSSPPETILAREGAITMYCEGGRSRTGKVAEEAKRGIGSARAGDRRAGRADRDPRLLPRSATGSDCSFPKVTVQYGDPMRWEPLENPTREQQQAVADQILAEIRGLYAGLEAARPQGHPAPRARAAAGRTARAQGRGGLSGAPRSPARRPPSARWIRPRPALRRRRLRLPFAHAGIRGGGRQHDEAEARRRRRDQQGVVDLRRAGLDPDAGRGGRVRHHGHRRRAAGRRRDAARSARRRGPRDRRRHALHRDGRRARQRRPGRPPRCQRRAAPARGHPLPRPADRRRPGREHRDRDRALRVRDPGADPDHRLVGVRARGRARARPGAQLAAAQQGAGARQRLAGLRGAARAVRARGRPLAGARRRRGLRGHGRGDRRAGRPRRAHRAVLRACLRGPLLPAPRALRDGSRPRRARRHRSAGLRRARRHRSAGLRRARRHRSAGLRRARRHGAPASEPRTGPPASEPRTGPPASDPGTGPQPADAGDAFGRPGSAAPPSDAGDAFGRP